MAESFRNELRGKRRMKYLPCLIFLACSALSQPMMSAAAGVTTNTAKATTSAREIIDFDQDWHFLKSDAKTLKRRSLTMLLGEIFACHMIGESKDHSRKVIHLDRVGGIFPLELAGTESILFFQKKTPSEGYLSNLME